MITDAQVAQLCWAIRQAPTTVRWDHFDDGSGTDGVCWAVVVTDDAIVVIDRGSLTFLDWLRDAEAGADPFIHDGLGPVHPGFFRGMTSQLAQLFAKYGRGRPYKFCGHSKGAAGASLKTGLAILEGERPLPRCVMGEPCSTFQQGADIIARAGGVSYRNGNESVRDFVTGVPYRFWPELYAHATQMTDISEVPDDPNFPPSSPGNPLSWHHDYLYVRGISKLVQQTKQP